MGKKEKEHDADNEFWDGAMKKGKCVKTGGEDEIHLVGLKLEYPQPHSSQATSYLVWSSNLKYKALAQQCNQIPSNNHSSPVV